MPNGPYFCAWGLAVMAGSMVENQNFYMFGMKSIVE